MSDKVLKIDENEKEIDCNSRKRNEGRYKYQ